MQMVLRILPQVCRIAIPTSRITTIALFVPTFNLLAVPGPSGISRWAVTKSARMTSKASAIELVLNLAFLAGAGPPDVSTRDANDFEELTGMPMSVAAGNIL